MGSPVVTTDGEDKITYQLDAGKTAMLQLQQFCKCSE